MHLSLRLHRVRDQTVLVWRGPIHVLPITRMTAFELQNRFRPYLLPGEQVRWSGEPKRGIALRGPDAYLVPFSLIWTGFVVSMLIDTFKLSSTPDFMLILFLAVGIYMTIGRFIHDAAIRQNLAYAVTNQRILILGGRQSSRLTSLDIRHLPKLELTQYGDGTGSIAFESDGPFSNWGRNAGFGIWVPSLNPAAQLFRIRDAHKVYEIIREQAHP